MRRSGRPWLQYCKYVFIRIHACTEGNVGETARLTGKELCVRGDNIEHGNLDTTRAQTLSNTGTDTIGASRDHGNLLTPNPLAVVVVGPLPVAESVAGEEVVEVSHDAEREEHLQGGHNGSNCHIFLLLDLVDHLSADLWGTQGEEVQKTTGQNGGKKRCHCVRV